jgi:nucleotide-binding universal stress UspA family protein
MYKNILIPIDVAHSEKAEEMIATAEKLSDADTNLILLTVVYNLPAYTPVDLTSDYFEIAKTEAKAALSKISGNTDLKTSVEVQVGDAHNNILETAKAKEADLIIIGSHKPGFSDYLLGSTASRVVRHAQCPVMVLR